MRDVDLSNPTEEAYTEWKGLLSFTIYREKIYLYQNQML